MPWKSLTTEDTEIQRIAQRRSRIEKDLSQKVELVSEGVEI
jgi:hypothetical protein